MQVPWELSPYNVFRSTNDFICLRSCFFFAYIFYSDIACSFSWLVALFSVLQFQNSATGLSRSDLSLTGPAVGEGQRELQPPPPHFESLVSPPPPPPTTTFKVAPRALIKCGTLKSCINSPNCTFKAAAQERKLAAHRGKGKKSLTPVGLELTTFETDNRKLL